MPKDANKIDTHNFWISLNPNGSETKSHLLANNGPKSYLILQVFREG